MAKVIALDTVYMPTGLTGKGQPKWERYEDGEVDDDLEFQPTVYEISDERLQEFLDTGNFKVV